MGMYKEIKLAYQLAAKGVQEDFSGLSNHLLWQ